MQTCEPTGIQRNYDTWKVWLHLTDWSDWRRLSFSVHQQLRALLLPFTSFFIFIMWLHSWDLFPVFLCASLCKVLPMFLLNYIHGHIPAFCTQQTDDHISITWAEVLEPVSLSLAVKLQLTQAFITDRFLLGSTREDKLSVDVSASLSPAQAGKSSSFLPSLRVFLVTMLILNSWFLVTLFLQQELKFSSPQRSCKQFLTEQQQSVSCSWLSLCLLIELEVWSKGLRLQGLDRVWSRVWTGSGVC